SRQTSLRLSAIAACDMPTGQLVQVETVRPKRPGWLLRLDAALDQDALGAVVPDVHLGDLAIPHHEAVDVAVALERGPILPFAIERADAVDHGLAVAWADVEPVHLLLDPAVALGV